VSADVRATVQAAPSPDGFGLTEAEVERRRAAGQGNSALPPSGRTYAEIVRENVFTFINNVLFLLAAALILVGRPVDAIVSVGVVLLNVSVSVVQEVRAKRLLDRIALLTRPTATVVRDGQERSVPPEGLVVGDVVRASPGDQIVLDGAVLDGRMEVDESLLTGESDAIGKGPGDPVYSGTFCVGGGAHYTVQRVGTASLANQITAGARSFRRVLTPLQRQVNLVVRIVLLIVVYLQLLVVLDDLLELVPVPQAVAQATVLAGLVPNGLFVSIAVAYALGAVRLIRSGALVQQSNAIESLSSVDVLCLDKTGTLTANRLVMRDVSALPGWGGTEADVRGILGVVTASAAQRNKTSAAILAACPGQARPVAAEVPFSSARKWSAVAFDAVPGGHDGAGPAPTPSPVVRDAAPQGCMSQPRHASAAGAATPAALRGVYVLGAPEMLRPAISAEAWTPLAEEASRLAGTGLRVLLLAYHPTVSGLGAAGAGDGAGDGARLPAPLTPLGLISLADELRPEAGETLAAFLRLGVRPKIISGDNPETVAALARQAGLSGDLTLVTGTELDALSDGALGELAEATTVFGRITPQQKERLVGALRARGHYVAMIGDGVNDVLALKRADLGIAMQSGAQATRSVAGIVLTDDSFAALVPAVAEGQRIVNGMQAILKLFLTRIATEALLIVSALAVGPFPLALRHTAVLAMVTAGVPAFCLALWARPGRHEGSLGWETTRFVVPAAVLSSLIGVLVWCGVLVRRLLQEVDVPSASPLIVPMLEAAASRGPAQTALTVFLVLVGLLLIVFVAPPTPWWTGAVATTDDRKPALLAALLLLLFLTGFAIPPVRELYALHPLEPIEWTIVALAALAWLVLVRYTWRHRLLARFLNLDVPGDPTGHSP
jgi:cation-transporting ATPase E